MAAVVAVSDADAPEHARAEGPAEAAPAPRGAPEIQESHEEAQGAPSEAEVFLQARQQNFAEVSRLVQLCPQHWRAQDEEGHYLLHWAALVGNTEFAAAAMEHGCPVDCRAKNLQTPLMWAALRGHIPVARLLLSAKADIRATDSMGATPVIIAVQHKSYHSLLLLVNRGTKAILSDADRNGCTPVHWAAYKGDMTALKFLEYFEADILALDGQKMLPMHRAVRASQHLVLEFLMEKRSDPNLRNAEGKNCFDMAEDQNDGYSLALLKKLTKQQGMKIEGKDGVQGDVEQGQSRPSQEEATKGKKEGLMKTIMKDQVAQKAFPAFWIVCVSMATCQYLIELRDLSYSVVPFGCLLFELGVPLSLLLFAMTALSDPGIIPRRPKGHTGVEELMRAIDSDQSVLPDFGRLCTTTWHLKDRRTKFCTETGECVAEFDHYCVWLNTAIGKGNHRVFIGLAAVEVFTQLSHIYVCWNTARTIVVRPSFFSWLGSLIGGYPLLFFLLLIQILTVPWIAMLVFHQCRIVGMNLTTNEMMNLQRYEHFWITNFTSPNHSTRTFTNPFNKGSFFKNCLDFWIWRRRSEAVEQDLHACGHGCKHHH